MVPWCLVAWLLEALLERTWLRLSWCGVVCCVVLCLAERRSERTVESSGVAKLTCGFGCGVGF